MPYLVVDKGLNIVYTFRMKSTTVIHARTTSVRKWGNGHGVLLPKSFVDMLDLAHAEVQTILRGSSIILTKTSAKKKITIKEMVRGMRKNDRHDLVDFGAPQGKEIW